MPNAQKLLLICQSPLAGNAAIRYTELGPDMRIQHRQPALSPKLMNGLRLTLILAVTTIASAVFGGTGNIDLQPAPSPTQEEVNHLNIFEYETTYSLSSDYKDYRGKFGDSDSIYNQIAYSHRF